ncbi:MAG: 1,4-alpha-glucan branching protein GlgB [Candidatus Binatus sp.]|uniref:1,4-alpha-glucan branching protein GlgB n=1 Tax=Candidatus Binatus sp. TaxID=2811406 RepID=UPI00272817E1|nr:1,4-alpha-glucan branching protein GlgB [Candidatus Binatus sp.]MDO8433760.1 1,4-alpha-glucan branching protein GlgB [Candidatus Binatus sp.]
MSRALSELHKERDEIDRLLTLIHHDPHSILGAHPRGQSVVVRAFRPSASEVELLVAGEAPRPMHMIDPAGLFEAIVEGHGQVFPYQLRIHYSDGESITIHDPYSFLPTLGEVDLYLWGEQKHERAYDRLGSHVREMGGVKGVSFAVWAPNANGVSVVGDFNRWDGRVHMMRMLGNSGVWELFIPGAGAGFNYKYEIRTRDGGLLLKCDPFAQSMEAPPATASVVYESSYEFRDDRWLAERENREAVKSPMSIYELHLGSWRRVPEDGDRPLTYREIAPMLGDYLTEMGFTHVELMPVMEHPFTGSWGYQVSGYFAPTARYGTPDDLRYLIDELHQRGIGVILDWVPAHFPKDAFSLGRFDGTALFEHQDPRQGHHPDWGTYIFNYGRAEVRSFLTASALYWLGEFHADGLRVDAVASMIYLDYGRRDGEWIPNAYGGRENLDALSFIKKLNQDVYRLNPGIMMIAEESTAWTGVSRPVFIGGLGFGFKWDMGWMHDTLEYFALDPIYRKYHHRDLTFGLLYAWSENFVLPISHDEVVHGKRALLSKMPGDRVQQLANQRALFGYMWARGGKKLIFMGAEFGQWREWNHDASLDWNLLDYPEHRGLQALVRDLNHLYRATPALWEADAEPSGFRWIEADAAADNLIAFMRIAPARGERVICVCNFSPVMRSNLRIGVPRPGRYREILNTDAAAYGGSNIGNLGGVDSAPIPWHEFDDSIMIELPPLSTIWFAAP